MKTYFKLFHYSSKSGLKEIDPAFYGTRISGVSELKRGSSGIKKSFYYTIDNPEAVVVTQQRYEVYLPEQWKLKLYDFHADPEQFWCAAKKRVLAERIYNAGEPTWHETMEAYERIIFERGYKGLKYQSDNDFNQLNNYVITLFHKRSTQKPCGSYTVLDYVTEKPVEVNRQAVQKSEIRKNFLSLVGFFKSKVEYKPDVATEDLQRYFTHY